MSTMVTVYELLGQLRSTALDERDKGDKFERLVKTFLLNDPEWSARFSNVWLWSEWPGRNGRPDTGVDLVAQIRDEDTLAAIQCKFYAPGATVSKGDIDSFLSASGGREFSRRYIFDTAKSWSPNAVDTLANQAVPVQRVDIAALEESEFDWAQYSWTTPEVLISRGKKALRPHQQAALNNVFDGFRTGDRGKLIMACGTGKTYTSLKIAEELVGAGGSVLFLVPSIQLLSQSLREWMANTEVEIRPFAVCSDVRVGRKVIQDDAADISTIDLTEPATTDAGTLVARMSVGRHAKDRMTVVFSTYQSIDVIAQAQQQGLAEFDLIICDEAHRTTGVTLAGATDESPFVRVHDNAYLQATKRLYMTATPRVFGEDVRRKASDAEAILADMNDEALYGPEFHRLGFGDAVEADLLTDYKVLVLAVDENYVAENFQNAMTTAGEIALPDAAKLLGCWNGLAKHYGSADAESEATRLKPMKTAVAFAKDIRASKAAAGSFPVLVDRALQEEGEHAPKNQLRVEAAHVDGTMGIHERNTHLAWLKEQTPEDVCRILTNARCLSEGVDVPALDAVMFLTPRGSQVDVVQSVGRVMRKAPGKELGYIILPIVVPSGVAPEEALKDNERYKVVWQVLQALRSHDDRFHAMVNQIELNKVKGSSRGTGPVIDISPVPGEETEKPARQGDGTEQGVLDFGFDGFRDAMYARIVKKVGERRYWETWAKDVSDIAQAHITRIRGLLSDPESSQAQEFEVFLDGLRGNLNDNITTDEAIEMLAQHLVTRPIFDALFTGIQFAANNPVAETMELMLASLDEHNLDAENQTLERFYASVRRRVQGVDNAEGKQRILIELYDKFFATAFRKTVDKLGIVYTPVEIVDFIVRSADEVLRAEFGQGLTDEGVHILDGFTGTGTFIVRLLQSGLITADDLTRKYANELHANEILLLAYYIAAVNIETTYADLTGKSEAFPGLILTDTFQSWEPDDRPDLNVFPENNKRLEQLKQLPITVIVGNPPYSAGQGSANENNANEKYPSLDAEIERTYAALSSSTSKRTLYDSYIRAIKWATLRIEERGVVAYVTNSGFLDSNSADGLRKSLGNEFTRIFVFNLRGNALGAGEVRKREGEGVFGVGSRAGVAITLLAKNPAHVGPVEVHYADIGDNLKRPAKLARIAAAKSFLDLSARMIEPNEHGDWLNQRRDDFATFLPIGEKGSDDAIFARYSLGMASGRDAWVYNFSSDARTENVQRMIANFNSELDARTADPAHEATRDATLISWNRNLEEDYSRGRRLVYDQAGERTSLYRPFMKVRSYLARDMNAMQYQMPRFFPSADVDNVGIAVASPRSNGGGTPMMTDAMPDQVVFSPNPVQFFPRWTYERAADEGTLDFGTDSDVGNGYRRIDNVTDEALRRFQSAYPADAVTKDDIFFYVYGLLHAPSYREAYSADLAKMLPRIPLVRDFKRFASAGRALSELHLGYESVAPYPLEGLDVDPEGDPFTFFAVGAKKMSFGRPSPDQKAAGAKVDRSTIVYNDRVVLRGVPDDAHRYMLGSRPAVEWVMERYYVKTDKASGIVNDPNSWSREVGDPRYIIDLLARVITVSVETTKIVDALPTLEVLAD